MDSRKRVQATVPVKVPPAGNCVGLNIESFEDSFLKKAYFLGENKLDRVLLSLLHQIDECSTEEHEGLTYLVCKKNFKKKINKMPKSIGYRYKKESLDRNFHFVRFSIRFGIPLDTINGIHPLRFKNARLVFHSLKLSYALYLTMKMFKVDKVKSNQRHRGSFLFLEEGNLLSQIFLHTYSSLLRKGLEEKDFIKCIKTSLCLMVSKAMEQDELPEGESFEIFPPSMWKRISGLLSDRDLVRFAFSCLQSKVLCQVVPESFILDSLIKHQKQLSSDHRGVSTDTLKKLRARGEQFGRLVSKFYKPNKGHFPTNKASFAFPRNMGGVKGDLVYHDRLKDPLVREDPDDRT